MKPDFVAFLRGGTSTMLRVFALDFQVGFLAGGLESFFVFHEVSEEFLLITEVIKRH